MIPRIDVMHLTAVRTTAKHMHHTSPLAKGPTKAPEGTLLVRASRRPMQDSLSTATRSVDERSVLSHARELGLEVSRGP